MVYNDIVLNGGGMVLLGYLFTILDYSCFCLSRFMKNKAAILALDLLAKVFAAIRLYCFNSLSGAYLFIAIFFMLIVANIKTRLNKRWLFGYLFFQCVYLIIFFYTYIGLSSILVTWTTSVSLFANWWLAPQKMRRVGSVNGFFYLWYQISIKNWAGLLEIFAIISNVLSYIKYKRISKRNKLKNKKKKQ